jgi:hypothetical protein
MATGPIAKRSSSLFRDATAQKSKKLLVINAANQRATLRHSLLITFSCKHRGGPSFGAERAVKFAACPT